MSDLWERSDRAICTHPGWATLRGWGPIAASFYALFQNAPVQFLLTEEHAVVVGDTAWVSVDENLLGGQGGATIAAINIFVRDTDRPVPGRTAQEAVPAGGGPDPHRWWLVCHHGSVVHSSIAGDEDPLASD